MTIFKNKKHRSMILAIITSFSLLLAGCDSKNSTVIESPSKVESSTNTNSRHKSNVINLIDINKSSNDIIKSTVDRVVDGDTIEIILPDGKEVDTRLLLIDTPETKHPNLGVQKYGPEASDFAKSILNQGDTVYFELDGSSSTDKYGRYLGYLWYTCPEHNTLEMYNERVVEEGLARVGYIYNQKKHLDSLLVTQETAKENSLNIWSIPGYVTDKGYDMSKVDDSSDSNDNKSDKESSSSNIESLVYANGGTNSSNKYHKSSNAHGMKGAIKLTKKEAKSQGYEPCSICFK